MLPVCFCHPYHCLCLLSNQQEKEVDDGAYALLNCCLARHVSISHALLECLFNSFFETVC